VRVSFFMAAQPRADMSSVDGKRRLVTYKEWDALIQKSFERCFYVPEGECLRPP
jgi:hypothetical protein